MSPQPLTLTPHPQRPWRPVGAAFTSPRATVRAAKRTFATPVVRELPPRREARVATATW